MFFTRGVKVYIQVIKKKQVKRTFKEIERFRDATYSFQLLQSVLHLLDR